MAENGGCQTATNKILWWIITVLTGLSTGAGANWLTSMDKLGRVEVKVEWLSDKVDRILDRLDKQR